jgi:glycolate oxidase FAD binding subunit
MTTAVENLTSTFSALLGAERVKSDEATRMSFALGKMLPDCVVSPGSEEEVAAALGRATELGLAVVPCRNGTKLPIGNTPKRYDVALCLREMNRIWHYEPADLTVTVETGMKLADFQRFVGKAGLWLALDPPFEAKASIGGILAANSSGPSRFLYGQARDLTLGMSVATSEGKVIRTGGRVVKNVTGYDLSKIFIGSFGTLGVITQASFKLSPLPALRASFRIRGQELLQIREFRRQVVRSPLGVQALEFVDERAGRLAFEGQGLGGIGKGPELWIQVAGVERAVARTRQEMGRLAQAVGAECQSIEQDEAGAVWSRLRDFPVWLPERYPQVTLLRAGLPPGVSEEFIAGSASAVEAAGGRGAVFAHLGSGIVRLCLLEPPGEDLAALIGQLREAAVRLEGSLILERASEELKGQMDVWGEAGDALGVMRQMKAAWDPTNTLSPGRFVGGI